MNNDDRKQKGKEAPDPMQSDVGRPEPVKETAETSRQVDATGADSAA